MMKLLERGLTELKTTSFLIIMMSVFLVSIGNGAQLKKTFYQTLSPQLQTAPAEDHREQIRATVEEVLREYLLNRMDALLEMDPTSTEQFWQNSIERLINRRRDLFRPPKVIPEDSGQEFDPLQERTERITNYVEALRAFWGWRVTPRFDLSELLPDLLASDLRIIERWNDLVISGGYEEAASEEAGVVIDGLWTSNIEKFREWRFVLSSLRDSWQNVHILNLEIFAEKVELILKRIISRDDLDRNFLQNLTRDEEEEIIIQEMDGKQYVLQGNHRLAALIILYRLGLIPDIEITVKHFASDDPAKRLLEHYLNIQYLKGTGAEQIDFDQLREQAREVYGRLRQTVPSTLFENL